MGISHSWGELAAKLDALAIAYAEIPRVAPLQSGELVKASIKGFAPGSLRHARAGRPAKLDVHVVASGERALVTPSGPWSLIERNTSGHEIRPRRRQALAWSGARHPVAYADHPGTRGQHPWEKGVTAARAGISKLLALLGAIPLNRIF